MTDSALPTIHPMTLPELFDRAIRLYRQNFFKFIGIFAIPYIPLVLIQTAFSIFTTRGLLDSSTNDFSNPDFMSSPGMIAAFIGSFVMVFVQFIFVQGVATAALTRAVANNYTGKPISILDSYRTLSTSWVKLIGALVIIFIMVMILVAWTMIPCVGWFTGPGILFFVGLSVSPLIPPVITLEQTGIFASIRRAWDLARSRFWWLIGCALVLTLFGQLIVSGPIFLMNFIMTYVVSSLSIDMETQYVITTITQTLINMSVSLLYVPLKLAIMTVIYFDLRARSEGLDLALQMPSFAPSTENDVINLPNISGKSTTPFITGIDIGRFALLTLIGIAFYGLITVVMFGILGLASGL